MRCVGLAFDGRRPGNIERGSRSAGSHSALPMHSIEGCIFRISLILVFVAPKLKLQK